ncbi:alkanesulfonate monooxygenase SsuD/methylene tetrahydromethanopterin reductase-like flavin-dependent oxidoreductase (luciferase family) [Prauserella sediminis]|uniref:Alkanesulfonate monooxygenase SsuD/methylene tetrahydromethanopterin reductase-like flavin-dependent oxidoreductase (Luciferase family) n=1 Tax=Prauserella sediminis TaxID=577680 RepID=A0A839XU83_9PSEU|nr:LLM class flavin-dependent oxidoreductase [Prauserella sediminis]MBB3665589.1 alkanesulfonate monooxygenase SsuD/methylene tetrahydromethanopterin reductase-like flavin-dependent oxidoreductase (luciferase family) [Prauserella sediminis]
MHFTMRFDFRNPDIGGDSTADQYAAALDMVEWADSRGFEEVCLSEHHGADDDYLPSPLPMLAAMAARTSRVRLRIVAMIGPFYDPLRMAEDLAVLDHLSRGRVEVVVGNGYVAEEFAMFDVPLAERARRVTDLVTTVKAALSGEPFEYRGRRTRLTPAPYRRGGPRISLGGAVPAVARRAARIADGFEPVVSASWEDYRAEVVRLGSSDPGPAAPRPQGIVFLAENPDEAWRALAPHFLHEMNSYGRQLAAAGDGSPGPYREVEDVAALRDGGRYRVLSPAELVTELRADPSRPVQLHPLCGGIPVAQGWQSLQLFGEQVLPELHHT